MVCQLCGLAGLNVDGLQRRKQIVGHQQPVESGEHPGMVDKPIARPCPAQHAVDPLRTPALERVASGMPEPRPHGLANVRAFFGAQQVLPDDVAVAVQGRHVGFGDRAVDRTSARRRPLVPLRQVAPKVLQRGDGFVVDAHGCSSLVHWHFCPD